MDAYTFIKGMATTDSDHNPERLGMMIVINAPVMLSVAWRVIQGVLDDVQRVKIKILSDPKQWQPLLLSIIDKDQIPIEYGGEAPYWKPEDGYSSMEPSPCAPTTITAVDPTSPPSPVEGVPDLKSQDAAIEIDDGEEKECQVTA